MYKNIIQMVLKYVYTHKVVLKHGYFGIRRLRSLGKNNAKGNATSSLSVHVSMW